MNQEHHLSRYRTFHKWHVRITIFVLLPLILIYGLLSVGAKDDPHLFTYPWHELFFGLSVACGSVVIITMCTLLLIRSKLHKAAR